MGSNSALPCFFCAEEVEVSKDCGNKQYTLNHTNKINVCDERCIVSTCRMLRIPSTHPAVAALLSTQTYCGGCMQVMRDLEFSVGAMDKLQQQILSLRKQLLIKLESKLEKLKRLDSQSSPPSTNPTNSSQDLFDFVIEKAKDKVELTDDDILLKNGRVLNESLQGSNNQEEEQVVEDIEIETRFKEEPLDEEDALNPAEYLHESLIIEESRDFNSCDEVDGAIENEDQDMMISEGEELEESDFDTVDTYDEVNNESRTEDALQSEVHSLVNSNYEIIVKADQEEKESHSAAWETCRDPLEFDRTSPSGDELERVEIERRFIRCYTRLPKKPIEESKPEKKKKETEQKEKIQKTKKPIEESKPEKKKKETEQKEKILKTPRERPPKGPWNFNTNKLYKKRGKNSCIQKKRQMRKRQALQKKLMKDGKLVVPCSDASCGQRFESNYELEIHIRQVHRGTLSKI